MCCHINGSLVGPVKNCVPKLRSVNSITSAPVKTGVDTRIINEVVSIDQPNSGMRVIVMPGVRMFKIVTMKLTAPSNDDGPINIRPRIHISVPGEDRKSTRLNSSHGYISY